MMAEDQPGRNNIGPSAQQSEAQNEQGEDVGGETDLTTRDQQQHGGPLCTFAVTGDSAPIFQPIFVCRTCRSSNYDENGGGGDTNGGDGSDDGEGRQQQEEEEVEGAPDPAPLCICQACSEACHPDSSQRQQQQEEEEEGGIVPLSAPHADTAGQQHEQQHQHEVDYIGLGPCYCDCRTMGHCRLADRSDAEAERLFGKSLDGFRRWGCGSFLRPQSSKEIKNDCDSGSSVGSANFPYEHGAFTISQLQDDGACGRLVGQAREMVRHTSDTFWVSPEDVVPAGTAAGEGLCELERLTLAIYRRHISAYGLDSVNVGEDEGVSGAEWWVQVKNVNSVGDNHGLSAGDGAVDLHYDKDEELAASFGLGSFPTLSTVTYLTGPVDENNVDNVAAAAAPSPPPTIVFPHTYDSTSSEIEGDVLVSHPRRGKHLVFDGRLLHGAPAHRALREQRKVGGGRGDGMKGDGTNDDDGTIRVTFLVNVWPTCRPAGVGPLPATVRRCIQSVAEPDQDVAPPGQDLEFEERQIGIASVDAAGDDEQEEVAAERIQLPFVSKGATWIDDDDDGGLVLSMVPPASRGGSNTMRVRYGTGMEPFLENLSFDNGDVDDDESSIDGYV